jgi:hypothetical protein
MTYLLLTYFLYINLLYTQWSLLEARSNAIAYIVPHFKDTGPKCKQNKSVFSTCLVKVCHNINETGKIQFILEHTEFTHVLYIIIVGVHHSFFKSVM